MKIFFDLDGTLVDVSARHHKVYCDVVAKFSGNALNKDEYWNLKRNKASWEDILPLSKIGADLKDEFLEEFIKLIENKDYLKLDKLIPGALKTARYLYSANTCYLVSLRRNPENLEAEINWLGLRPYFHKVLSGHSETDGSDVKTLLIRNALAENTGTIIGDTEADVLTGKDLGLTTIAVTSGIRSQEFLEHLNPNYICSTIAELPGVLAS